MALKKLNFETLGRLNQGALEQAMNSAMGMVEVDLFNRQGMDKKRKVKLELEYTPVITRDESGRATLEDVLVGFTVSHSIPARSTSKVRANVKPLATEGRSEVWFDVDLQDGIDGPSIMDEEKRAAEEREAQLERARQERMRLAQ